MSDTKLPDEPHPEAPPVVMATLKRTCFDGFGVTVTCAKCNAAVTTYGSGKPSIRRALTLLGETCPRGEKNTYLVQTPAKKR